MLEQCHAAQDNGQGHIEVTPHAVPEGASLPLAAGVDGREQFVLLHHIEPGHSTQGGADGDDVDGHQIHPGAPLVDGLHADAETQADDAENDQRRRPVELGELVDEGLRHCLEHILQGADAGEDHGHIEDDGKELAEGNVLQNGGQRDKEQAGAGAHVQTVGEAGGDHDQSGHQGGDGVKQRRVLCHAHHVFFLRKICTVDDHAAAGDGQGEERLSHGPDPDHGVSQHFPSGGEHERIALARAGQKGHTDGQDQEDHKEQGHHDLVGALNALCPQEQSQQGAHHHNDVEGDDRIGLRREGAEPGGSVSGHERAQHRIHQRLEDVGDDDGVADGDAHGAGQGQPAQQAAHLAHGLATGGPGVLVGA